MKTGWIIVIFAILSISACQAAEKPFRIQSLSPDRKCLAKIESSLRELRVYEASNKQLLLSRGFSTQDVQPNTPENDAWGIYDFVWSPDSQYIFFVFRPETMRTAAHTEDCFGIIDTRSTQYEWVAGPVVDKMVWQTFGVQNPNYHLRWLDNNTVSFRASEARLQKTVGRDIRTLKIKPAGIRRISVSKAKQRLTERAKIAQGCMNLLMSYLQTTDWQDKVRTLLGRDRSYQTYMLRVLSDNRGYILSEREIYITSYDAKKKSFTFGQGNRSSMGVPIEITNGKITDVITQEGGE